MCFMAMVAREVPSWFSGYIVAMFSSTTDQGQRFACTTASLSHRWSCGTCIPECAHITLDRI